MRVCECVCVCACVCLWFSCGIHSVRRGRFHGLSMSCRSAPSFLPFGLSVNFTYIRKQCLIKRD